MEINEIIGSIDNLKNTYFNNLKLDVDKVKDYICLDYQFFKDNDIDNIDGLKALVIYRLSRLIIDLLPKNDEIKLFFKLKNDSKNYTTSYISPYSIVDCPCGMFGEKITIDKDFVVNKKVKILSNVQLVNLSELDSVGVVGEGACIGNNVRIYNDAYIGNNSIINDNCTIRENIKNNSVVNVLSELQMKEKLEDNSELNVYGVVPKFKNSIIIYGEGFYNPKVKIVTPSNNIQNEITYWDKNKIVVKIKDFQVDKIEKNMLIIFSNGLRLTIFNAYGVQKTLKNLKK